jgi:hypothetical protein
MISAVAGMTDMNHHAQISSLEMGPYKLFIQAGLELQSS